MAKSRTEMTVNGPITIIETKDSGDSQIGVTINQTVSINPVTTIPKGGMFSMMGVG